MDIYLSANALRAIGLASDSKGREHLDGVCVEIRPHETRYVATNGHILAVYRVEQDNETKDGLAVFIPSWAIEKLPKQRGGKYATESPTILALNGDSKCKLTQDVVSIEFPMTCEFPSYSEIGPSEPSNKSATYDPELLSRFQTIALRLGAHLGIPHITHNGPTGAALVKVNGTGGDFFGLIMPIMSNEDDFYSSTPDWVRDTLAKSD